MNAGGWLDYRFVRGIIEREERVREGTSGVDYALKRLSDGSARQFWMSKDEID